MQNPTTEPSEARVSSIESKEPFGGKYNFDNMEFDVSEEKSSGEYPSTTPDNAPKKKSFLSSYIVHPLEQWWTHRYPPWMGKAYAGGGGIQGERITPRMDISQTKHWFKIMVELPGIKKTDVTLTIDQTTRTIIVSGEIPVPPSLIPSKDLSEEQKEEEETMITIERKYGKFERRITMPSNANISDIDLIKAEMTDGVLCIQVPKVKHDLSSVKRINIS